MPRIGISDADRKALRQFYYRSKPYPRHKDCIDWFQQKYGRKIAQSTVSESLSDGFKHLDDTESPNSNAYRQRQALWPILEAILFSWQQKIEYRSGLVSGNILIAKARKIWPLILEYAGKPVPDFSIGWLDKFKKRHGDKGANQP